MTRCPGTARIKVRLYKAASLIEPRQLWKPREGFGLLGQFLRNQWIQGCLCEHMGLQDSEPDRPRLTT